MEIQSRVDSYLLFKLGKELFAAHVDKVLNILEMLRITEVPKTPPYMKGVINLRGEVLPVIDTRVKFGMTPTKFMKNTCIIVMDIISEGESVRVGALVDQVVEVLQLEDKKLLPVPSIGDKYKTDFISNMAQYDEQFVMVLAVDKVFTAEEIIDLKNHQHQAKTKPKTDDKISKAKKPAAKSEV